MSVAETKRPPVLADYEEAFDRERLITYSVIDSLEAGIGFAIDRDRMEEAAFVLACPVKVNPPNWQHGRLVFSLVSKRVEDMAGRPVLLLDVGTAKGYSALCARWALGDRPGKIVSVDVMAPEAKVRRNSSLDTDGRFRDLAGYLEKWPEAADIEFLASTGEAWLAQNSGRVHFCFLDGKHRQDVVTKELALLSMRQDPGDVVLADDVHIPGVAAAIHASKRWYDWTWVSVLPLRQYAIGVRV